MKHLLPPAIVIHPQTTEALARAKRHRVAATGQRRSVSEMMSQLYVIAGEMLDELECTDLPLPARLAMAEKAARLLPMLDKAERRSRMGANAKAPEEMTDKELAAALKRYRRPAGKPKA